MARLGEIFNLQMGKTPARANNEYWDRGNNPWVSIADLSSYEKYVGATKELITDKAVEESGIKCVPANTVIMSFKLSLGKSAITKTTVYTNEAIIAFIPNGRYKVSTDYFYHFCSGKDWSVGTNRAVMGATLNKATLSDMDIDLPAIDIQDSIDKKLDKVDRLIFLRKQQLSKLDELVKARFVEMFGTFPANEKGWKIGTIRDVVAEVRYGSSRKAANGDSGQYPYLRMNNITYNGELDLTDTKTIDVPEEELSKCTVKRGDVLFNRTNSKELVGKTCVYNRDEMMVLAGFVVRVRVNDLVLPEFLSGFLNTDFSKKMLLGMCKTAIGQANINAQELQNIELYLPSIKLQEEFVEFKNKADKSKLTIQQSLDKLELLKKALMQEYFG